MDWDDLRYFLAVAETGSLSAAARQLGSHQPTVGRRIQTLEEHLGARLFKRHARGFSLNQTGQSVIDAVRAMAESATTVERRVTGRDARLTGRVRISAVDAIATLWLTPVLAKLQALHPGIEIVLTPASHSADLTRLEADIAIRLFRPTDGQLVARRVAALAFGLFAAPAYLEQHGTPEREKDLARHALIDFDDRLSHLPESQWLSRASDGRPPVFRSESTLTRAAAAAAGIGISVLSLYGVAGQLGLLRILPKAKIPKRDIWLVTHADLKQSARMRATLDFLAESFRRDRAIFDPDS